jgi:hypothetical protein
LDDPGQVDIENAPNEINNTNSRGSNQYIKIEKLDKRSSHQLSDIKVEDMLDK